MYWVSRPHSPMNEGRDTVTKIGSPPRSRRAFRLIQLYPSLLLHGRESCLFWYQGLIEWSTSGARRGSMSLVKKSTALQ
jgi:hypothetical protein